MRARHLGAIGESELANSLYRLALAAAPRFSASLRTAGVLAAVVGWKTVGKVSMLRERLPV